MAAGDEGAMDVRIHPLVVMSIADHYTRDKEQLGKTRAIGTLFGQQNGRVVSVLEAFEIATKVDEKDNKKFTLELEAFEKDMKLFSEAYPDYECLGWYSTGEKPSPADADIHTQMTKYNERPLYLMMDPNKQGEQRELPITVYEQTVHVTQNVTTTAFAPTNFQISADEAERITVVHCAKVVTREEKGQSAVAAHYITLRKAIFMLNARLKMLTQFLKDVQDGKIQPDQKHLRQIKGLCNRLPTMDSDAFRADFYNEYNDGLLVTYLSAITKGTSLVNEVVDKFNVAFGQQGRRGMGGGGGPHPMMF